MDDNSSLSSNTFKYAGFRKRLLAYLVDMLIISLIGFGLQSLLGQNPLEILKANSLAQYQELITNRSVFPSVLMFILTYGFYILMWVNNKGATPGKELMGIKIVKTDGSSVDYPAAILRSVFGYTLSSIVLSLGFFWVIWDKKKQGWHDKIAGTVVVETGRKPRIALAVFLSLVGIFIFLSYMFIILSKTRQLMTKEIKAKPAQTVVPKSRF